MISVFELFKIGIGPSSSHTVGPMKAAPPSRPGSSSAARSAAVAAVRVTLYGSLAYTGRGHATDKAVILGLAARSPNRRSRRGRRARRQAPRDKRLPLAGRRTIAFDPVRAVVFDVLTPPPRHPNTLRLVAKDAEGATLGDETWLSVGGGFVIREERRMARSRARRAFPIPFARAPSFWRAGANPGSRSPI